MFYFHDYVPVAQRRLNAKKEHARILGKGQPQRPVEAFKGQIAKSPLGRAWCEHVDRYAEEKNRLARGKTYLRNGSISHIEILDSRVRSYVSGSRLYSVQIDFMPLSEQSRKNIMELFAATPLAAIDLSGGNYSEEASQILASGGLFPTLKDMDFACSCPDYVMVCKHVAATLFALGGFMDESPELLFNLRNTSPLEFVPDDICMPAADEFLSPDSLKSIFNIELEPGPIADSIVVPVISGQEVVPVLETDKADSSENLPEVAPPVHAVEFFESVSNKPVRAVRAPSSRVSKKEIPEKKLRKRRIFNENKPTAAGIKKLRTFAGMSQREFAEKLGVSTGSVVRWEKARHLSIFPATMEKILAFQEELLK